jgi:hypothetical protein
MRFLHRRVSLALAGSVEEAELTTDSPDFMDKRIPCLSGLLPKTPLSGSLPAARGERENTELSRNRIGMKNSHP